MKRVFRWIMIILLIVFVLIQFIRPEKNKSTGISDTDISTLYYVPDSIQTILKVACYDCHSNNTLYPWYSEIQPVAWWLDDHVKDGKKNLNYSEFAKYRIRKQYIKLEETEELVNENVMPLPSYTWIHKDAILTERQKQAIIGWSSSIRDSLKAKFPPDSFLKR